MKKLFVAAVALSVLSGCAYLQKFLSAAFKEPAFVFKKVDLTDISLGGLNLDTVWELNNPNPVGISLAQADYALFIENKQVVAGQPANGLQIAPNGATELHFPAGIKFQDVVGVVETFLTKDLASWRAEGFIGVQTPIGVLRFPIAKEGQFEVPKIPQVAFGNPKVTSLTFQGATIEFPLTVTNRNTYALPVQGLGGQLAIAGGNVGTISTGDLGSMEGKVTKQIAVPISINFMQAAGAAVNAVRGGNAQVTFNAQLQSGGQQVPIRVDQLVNFIR